MVPDVFAISVRDPPVHCWPLVVAALVLRTIEAFKVFDIIWVMTRGGPANSTRTLSILVYQEAFSFQRAGSGASLALIVTLLVTLCSPRLRNAGSQERRERELMETSRPSLQYLHLHLRSVTCSCYSRAGLLAFYHEHLASCRSRRKAVAVVAAYSRLLPVPCVAVNDGKQCWCGVHVVADQQY